MSADEKWIPRRVEGFSFVYSVAELGELCDQGFSPSRVWNLRLVGQMSPENFRETGLVDSLLGDADHGVVEFVIRNDRSRNSI